MFGWEIVFTLCLGLLVSGVGSLHFGLRGVSRLWIAGGSSGRIHRLRFTWILKTRVSWRNDLLEGWFK